jgi:hypothetical protein
MTSTTLKQVSWLAALTLGAGLGLSTPSEACSAPACMPDVEVPLPASGTVPANVPALVLLSTQGATLVTSGANAPRLLRSNGDVVATSTVTPGDAYRAWHVVPASPLVPGETYRLQGVGECDYSGSSRSVEASFTAGAAQPLPAATGTLRVETTARGNIRVHADSLCSAEQDSSYVRLRFTPSPELVPFLPWVRWTLEVDGARWAGERHGAVLADGSLGPPTQWQSGFGERRLFQVHARCGSQNNHTDPGLTPGRHRATLRPVLAQTSTSLPPVEVDFELSCETQAPSEPEPPRDVEKLPLPGHGCSHAGGANMLALPLLLSLRFLLRRRTRHVSQSGS